MRPCGHPDNCRHAATMVCSTSGSASDDVLQLRNGLLRVRLRDHEFGARAGQVRLPVLRHCGSLRLPHGFAERGFEAAMAELRGLEPLTSSMPSTVGTREHLSCSGQTVLRCTWRSVCTEAVGKQFGKRCVPFSVRRLRPLSWLPMLRTTTCRAGQTLAGDREPQPTCPALSSLASRPRQRSSRHYLPSQLRAR